MPQTMDRTRTTDTEEIEIGICSYCERQAKEWCRECFGCHECCPNHQHCETFGQSLVQCERTCCGGMAHFQP